MKEMRLDGKTAIVTGAGGNPGLGRAHALLLAERGASVVVNDIGRDPEAQGYKDTASAAAVAEEIVARGGKAIADTHSIATEAGAYALVAAALEAFGSVDILVNNAGTASLAMFDELSSADIQRHVDVNLLGTAWTCRAAWPHMKQRGYGRIVNTGSGSMGGAALLSAYGMVKAGVFSLSRSLATEGAPHGIKVNTLLPAAYTRMMEAQQIEDSPFVKLARENYPPELVSPMVILLAHESCPVSGECFAAGGNKVQRILLSETTGLTLSPFTPEQLYQNLERVMATEGASVIEPGYMDTSQWSVKPYVRKKE